MQLHTVKISNILSYPYIESMGQHDGIIFRPWEKSTVNVLIGPNGSGKSNFLEIVNQAFKIGMSHDFSYDRERVHHIHNKQQKSNEQNKAIIQQQAVRPHTLHKHFSYETKKSQIYLSIVFNTNDFDNMRFIARYRNILNRMIETYSTCDFRIPAIDIKQLIFHNTLNIYCSVDMKRRSIVPKTRWLSNDQIFLLNYIRYFELIQICMKIYNKLERTHHERKRYPLKNTFAMLGSYRHFGKIKAHQDVSKISDEQISKTIAHEGTHHQAHYPIWYYLCKKKLLEWFTNHEQWPEEHIYDFSTHQPTTNKNTTIETIITNDPFYHTLNEAFDTYINMRLVVCFVKGNMQLFLKDHNNHTYHFNDLSSGDQSFALIIFTVYGYDLRNGFMMIDEPEINLHPQTQKGFMNFISRIAKQFGMQFIIATHSPLMINEHNIHHVYKFSKQWLNTHIQCPQYRLTHNEASLIQMLTYTNSAKIFFVDKIIMVEGDTDSYFFDYYLEHLRLLPERKQRINDYEIINIGGKWWARKRQRFLRKFGLKTYYIGDWDNVVEAGIIHDLKLRSYKKAAHRLYMKGNIKFSYQKTKKYAKLVNAIKRLYPEDYKIIVRKIKKLYDQWTFIMQYGDLETYLWLPVKWLESTVGFCQNKFHKWINDSRFDTHRQDRLWFFEKIFPKKEWIISKQQHIISPSTHPVHTSSTTDTTIPSPTQQHHPKKYTQ